MYKSGSKTTFIKNTYNQVFSFTFCQYVRYYKWVKLSWHYSKYKSASWKKVLTMIVTLFRNDFGCHVFNSTAVCKCSPSWRPIDILFTKAKIDQFDEALGIKQNILWLRSRKIIPKQRCFLWSFCFYQVSSKHFFKIE